MELILPKAEIWEQGDTLEDMWKHIARCTRVCYQSEKKDDNETEEQFVKRVILKHEPLNSDKNHLAMLEHGTVYLNIFPDDDFSDDFITFFMYNKYSICVRVMFDNVGYAITTNLRVITEGNIFSALRYLCVPTIYHKRRVTVSFTTNIGVTREFNRHRVNSMAEESTRYCNYTLNKFGNHVKCCKPSWLLDKMPANFEVYEQLALDNLIKDYGTEQEHNWEDIDYYLFALMVSNYCYNNLIRLGWKPQQAREVLPLATKSQLIHTAFVDDWKHFFVLRADGISGPVHPNAKLVAEPLKQEFVKRNLL